MKSTLIALLATILATTLPGISQEPGKPAPAETTTSAATFPAVHTITDTKGRSMEGVVLSKTETSITFERAADRKRFEVKLDTLSEADRAFVARLAEAPVNKPILLYIGYHGSGATATNDLIVGNGQRQL